MAARGRGNIARMPSSRSTDKTAPTAADVGAYLAAKASPAQRGDVDALMALLARVSGEQPVMWGPSIVGYGAYRYTYESGRSGTSCLVGFAIRGREIVVYLVPDWDGGTDLLARLGKHKMGKGCLYLKTLADVDVAVLEQLISGSMQELKRRHPG